MTKPIIPCPKCNTPLVFRRWSKRDGEALADCVPCSEKWQVRLFSGSPTCEPYQVKRPAAKTERGSWRLPPERAAAICAVYGSVQKFLDTQPLVCMSLQHKL